MTLAEQNIIQAARALVADWRDNLRKLTSLEHDLAIRVAAYDGDLQGIASPPPLRSIKDRPELTALLVASIAAYKAMTDEEKEALHKAQAESWVRGETELSKDPRAR